MITRTARLLPATLLVAIAALPARAEILDHAAMTTYRAALAQACPQKHSLDLLAPATLLDDEFAFRQGLPAVDRRRVDDALPQSGGGGVRVCINRDSASCDVDLYLRAFAQQHLMSGLAAFVCTHH